MIGATLELSEADRAEYDQLAAEADYEDRMLSAEAETESHELGWVELRREIMRRGGIASGPYTRHWLPGQVYRVNGAAPDVLAADMADEGWGTWEDADGFLAQLWTLFEAFKAQQEARRRQLRSASTVAPEPAAELEDTDGSSTDSPRLPALWQSASARSLGLAPASTGLQMRGLSPRVVCRGRPGRPPARRSRGRPARADLAPPLTNPNARRRVVTVSTATIEYEPHDKPTYQVRVSFAADPRPGVFPKQSRAVAEAEARQWLDLPHVARVVIRLPRTEA